MTTAKRTIFIWLQFSRNGWRSTGKFAFLSLIHPSLIVATCGELRNVPTADKFDPATISQWNKCFRDIIVESLKENDNLHRIGGSNTIVAQSREKTDRKEYPEVTASLKQCGNGSATKELHSTSFEKKSPNDILLWISRCTWLDTYHSANEKVTATKHHPMVLLNANIEVNAEYD
ncbi:hypothetical protein RB195_000150 [Necator americanus]|uniref:Uncharacterized protein n=1 Tax=Necator americanus TaxID=51031 RepID=A0ABR1D876_NECAM